MGSCGARATLSSYLKKYITLCVAATSSRSPKKTGLHHLSCGSVLAHVMAGVRESVICTDCTLPPNPSNGSMWLVTAAPFIYQKSRSNVACLTQELDCLPSEKMPWLGMAETRLKKKKSALALYLLMAAERWAHDETTGRGLTGTSCRRIRGCIFCFPALFRSSHTLPHWWRGCVYCRTSPVVFVQSGRTTHDALEGPPTPHPTRWWSGCRAPFPSTRPVMGGGPSLEPCLLPPDRRSGCRARAGPVSRRRRPRRGLPVSWGASRRRVAGATCPPRFGAW